MKVRIGDKLVEGKMKDGVLHIKVDVKKDEKGNVNVSVPCLQVENREG